MHPHVFVLDKHHRPLQPCPPARARKLLAKGAARILARAEAPLRDTAAAQSVRWALWRALESRLPTRIASGGRTKYNRARNHLPKTHTLDALAVGTVDTVTDTVTRVLAAACTGRGTHARTRPDRHGFPRPAVPRKKAFFGYQTGDLVRAVAPAGENEGTCTGRVAVRARGYFNVTTARGTAQGVHHRRVRPLQRADGYGYTTRKEGAASSPA
ncbi:RRXRR domain-containing protein [Streptomonospora salina]|uniref:RRXRR domain-containing protein n=1 Tax=Streptomonospora salina TaxID=104205 RepID=A0A841E480_9ACTN|nr:RRXRR domain-containing protein [Streptomonospora salina]MBB5997552.1 hypothetical protein [Streptomonospora salina]